ncbi:MAG: hypothetical protein HN742_30380 [Lentisphaerae bacterium]|nr:hypothetical protein [Lentisphaerota bacterium]MBT5606579.1 hypothetical protein [Lentisphaerota bacterium]MBT7846219.1 hypothetical protein [Lentisphaerota bacterium]
MTHQLSVRDRSVWIVGLLFKCPLGTPELHCPLQDLRDTPIGERIRAVYGMPDREKERVICRHQACLAAREQANTQVSLSTV